MDDWVNVNEKMPKNLVDVLCYYIRNMSIYQKVMCLNIDGEWQGEDDLNPKGENVTHWMPLPKPPNVRINTSP